MQSFKEFIIEESNIIKGLKAPKIPLGYKNGNPRKEAEVTSEEIRDWASEFEFISSKAKSTSIYYTLFHTEIRSKGIDYYYTFLERVWLPRLKAANYPKFGTEDMDKFNQAWKKHYLALSSKIKEAWSKNPNQILKYIEDGTI